MSEIPYLLRLGILVALAMVMILRDRLRGRGNNERVWEYGFLFFAGGIGAVYGMVNDAITVGISPEYFTLGKGLIAGGELRGQAILLGAKAGFSAGAIACVIWQFVLGRIPAARRCRVILRLFWIPFILTGIFAVFMPVVLGRADPFGFEQQLTGLVSAENIASFFTVWWAHIGAYLGLVVGLLAGIGLSRHQEKKNGKRRSHMTW